MDLELNEGKMVIKDSGAIEALKQGVAAYLSAAADTTITTGGTYYPVAGTFTNTYYEQFSLVAGPAIQYDGVETHTFEIDINFCGSTDTTGTTLSIGVKKNTTVQTGWIAQTFMKNIGQLYTASATCVVDLTTDDTIQLVMTSNKDTNDITTTTYTTTIRRFFH